MRLLAKLALVTFILLSSGGLGAAAVISGAEPEQLVEGHTVFTVIEQLPQVCPPEEPNCEPPTEYAAAVAVLVREVQLKNSAFKTNFPGVLWFNDQYLVNPRKGGDNSNSDEAKPSVRYPCSGAVIATLDGAPTPPLDDPTAYNDLTYVESYDITPPVRDLKTWTIDKWLINGVPVWTVAMRGDDTGYSTPDDGVARTGCEPTVGQNCMVSVPGVFPCLNNPYTLPVVGNPNTMQDGTNYPCPGCNGGLSFNALLYFKLEDLGVPSGAKNHTTGSTDLANDYGGCHPTPGSAPYGGGQATQYPCPAGDDTREGNSHRYNSGQGWPIAPGVSAAHGGSADCTGDTVPDEDCHGTYNVVVYYGVAAEPTERHTVVNDYVGNTAPYHCHDDPRSGWCNKAESPFADAPVIR